MTTTQYAKDQPSGFKNRIENVAIVGAGGQIGINIAKALVGGGKHTVTAITRTDSTATLPTGVKVAPINYDDEKTIVDALRGQDFLIVSLAVTAPSDTQDKLFKAAAEAGVPWVMPNCYGSNFLDKKYASENLTGPKVWAGIESAEKKGLSWVALACNFWYEFSLAVDPFSYGFDFDNKKMTFYNNGKTKITTSTWLQCGRAMLSLLSLKVLPQDENDTSTTLSNWRNKPLFISSFTINQRDMLDSVNRVSGKTDADWDIAYEPSEDRYKRGLEMMKTENQHLGFGIALYARAFFPAEDGNLEARCGLANDDLGLPKEDIDEATKRALDIVKGRTSPKDKDDPYSIT